MKLVPSCHRRPQAEWCDMTGPGVKQHVCPLVPQTAVEMVVEIMGPSNYHRTKDYVGPLDDDFGKALKALANVIDEAKAPRTRTLSEVRREAVLMTLEKFGTLSKQNYGVGVENVMANLEARDRLRESRAWSQ